MTVTEEPQPAPGWDAPSGLASHSPTSVVLPPKRPRRRAGPVVLAALLMASAVAIGTPVVAAQVRHAVRPTTFSLPRALAAFERAPGTRMAIRSTAYGTTMDITSTIDTAHSLVALEMSFASSFGTGNSSIRAIVDTEQSIVWIESSFFGDAEELDGKDWVRIQRTTLEDAGLDTSFFDQIRDAGTLNLAAILSVASATTEVGDDELDGTPVRVFDLTVRTDDVPELVDTLDAQLQDADVQIPEEITYTVFVSEDNHVVRVAYDLDLGIVEEKNVNDIEVLDEAPSIEVPADDDVIDARELL